MGATILPDNTTRRDPPARGPRDGAGRCPHRALLLALIAVLCALPEATLAGGFEVPDNGTMATGRGAAFTVRADDPSAIAHNPGGLTRLKGTHLLYNHALFNADSSFTRSRSVVAATQDYGDDPFATVHNSTPWFLLGGMAVVATDFGLDDWRFAAGVYGPSATGKQTFPEQGGQRYMLTGLDLMLVYYSAAVAWGKKDSYGIGVTLQGVHQIDTSMSMIVDAATGAELNPYYGSNDVHALISLSAPLTVSAIVGAWLRINDSWEIAASGRVLPAHLKATGDFSIDKIDKQTEFSPEQLQVDNSAARLELTIPPTARAGVRYRQVEAGVERFDVELDFVWEGWSTMKEMNVELDGIIKLFAAHEAPDISLQRRWKDTLSLRLGGTYNLPAAPVSISAGGFVESGAVPQNYSHLDFASFDRLGLGAGVAAKLGAVDVLVAYSHVFQEDRKVDERDSKVYQIRPITPCPEGCNGYNAVPSNAGLIETSFDIVSLGLRTTF